MESNFDIPRGETVESRSADRGKPHRLGGRIAALALAISSGAAVITLPSDAEAQSGTSIDFIKFVSTAKGKIVNGIFIGDATPDGWFTDTKVRIRINLEGIFTKDFLKELADQDVEFELDGEIKHGIYTGKVTPKGDILISGKSRSCAGPDCTPRPPDCGTPPCRSGRRSETPARAPLVPEPASSDEAESGLVRLKKPFDPGTFYVDKPDNGKSMGEGHPRGFDIPKGIPLTFFVTGDPNGKTRVSIELHPWVYIDEKKRGASGKMKVKVTIDGEEYEILPQPLAKGKILPSSKEGEAALWDAPLKLGTIPVPPGTHEIVVTSSCDYGFRAVLRGATETSKPAVDPAIEYPFEEDPDFPPEFSVNARLVSAPDEPSGYQFKPITPSPVKLNVGAEKNGLNVRVERLPNSPLVLIYLEKGEKGEVDHAVYVSEKPLEPETDYRVRFTRVSPPARSFNAGDSPEALALHIKVAVDAATSGVTGFEIDKSAGAPTLPDGMECKTIKANLFCSDRAADESRVRAYRTRLDIRPTDPVGKARRHILRQY